MPIFCYFALTDAIIKVYVVDLKPHFWQMLLPYMCEMVVPQLLLLIVDIFCQWQMLLPYLLSVVDDKPLFSVLWLMLLPWWLVLLPLSCIFLADVIAIVADVIAT